MKTTLFNIESVLSEGYFSQLNVNFFGTDYFYVTTYFNIINFLKYSIN